MARKDVNCPKCEAPLSVSAALPPGKKIKCPDCDAIFRVPDVDDDYEDLPVRRQRPGRKKQGNQAALIVAIAAVALLALGGATWGVIALINSSGAKKEVVEGKDKRPPGPLPGANFLPNGGPGLNPAAPNGPGLPQADESPQVGQTVPEIEGEDIDGQRFKLSDYRGKVVVLDFWGNW
jgi:hypothetical protein